MQPESHTTQSQQNTASSPRDNSRLFNTAATTNYPDGEDSIPISKLHFSQSKQATPPPKLPDNPNTPGNQLQTWSRQQGWLPQSPIQITSNPVWRHCNLKSMHLKQSWPKPSTNATNGKNFIRQMLRRAQSWSPNWRHKLTKTLCWTRRISYLAWRNRTTMWHFPRSSQSNPVVVLPL